PATRSAKCYATSRTATSSRCWSEPTSCRIFTKHSRPSWTRTTSAIWSSCRIPNGTNTVCPMPPDTPAQVEKRSDRTRTLELIDTQAGGDVSRIVLDGVKPLPGNTVREQQQYLEAHGDGLRRLLLSEPYGDPAQ